MSIFDETDKIADGKKTTSDIFASNVDEKFICENMENLLAEEKDFKSKSKETHDSQGGSSLLNQFETADKEAAEKEGGFTGGPFDSFGFSHQANESDFKFPNEDQNYPKMDYGKPFCKSNPTPSFSHPNYQQDFGSTPNTGYGYYQQSYSPFDQLDQVEYQAQHSSPFTSPDNFNCVYNGQYYGAPNAEDFKSPEVDLGYNYNSGGGNIFAAFDQQEKANPFDSNSPGGERERMQFPSNNMSSNTSSQAQQFAANASWNYNQANRISCPSKLKSKGKFDSKLKVSAPKFKSGETGKSIFIKNFETRLEDPNSDVVISEILGQGKFAEAIKSQKCSRFVQNTYYITSEEEKDMIFEEIKETWKDLMNDKFSNYVIQKIFENGPESQKKNFSARS